MFYLSYCYIQAGMHRRGSRGAAPVSDAARHGDARGTPLTARRCRFGPRLPRGFFFFSPTYADATETRPDSHRIGLIRADSGRIGRNRRNRRNGRFKPIQAEIQTLSLTPTLVSLLCALCGVRVLGFTESLSASLSLLSVSVSPQQHNTNATLLARDKELQYKKTLITQNALCFVFYWTP